MIGASDAFHAAVRGSHPNVRALCLWSDPAYGEVPSLVSTMIAVTSEDITSSGINVVESVNGETELEVGQVMSSTLSFSMFNDNGRLSDSLTLVNYKNDCAVYLGVKTAAATEEASNASCVAMLQYGRGAKIKATGHSSRPYLCIDGVAASQQPPFPVEAIFIDEDYDELGAKISCIGAEVGEVWSCYWKYGATWGDLETRTWGVLSNCKWGEFTGEVTDWVGISLSVFMAHKLQKLALSHRSFSRYGTDLYEFFTDGGVEKWEYKSLGVFRVDAPKISNQFIINVTAYDKITQFDKNVADFVSSLSYPTTLRVLYNKLCEYCGVDYTDATFPNSTMSIDKEPDLGETVTGRDLLGYIAEIACCNARMNRAGQIRLTWYNDHTDFILTPTETVSVAAANYQVGQITGVEISVSQNEGDPITVSLGGGSNMYKLSDNPLLKNKTADRIRSIITPIYNRLAGFAPFYPATATCICDWSLQAGDIISLQTDSETTIPVPIYTQTISFSGLTWVTYESTGEAVRPDVGLRSGLRASRYGRKYV